jgi:pyruvate/2-oxoglutarate dehydrogenase complex dihydrolipoamide dehydrogenase (E3) component
LTLRLGRPGADEAIAGELNGEAALDWRNYMVSDYDDSGQVKWLGDNGIELIRGEGKIVEHGIVQVADCRYSARHVVIASGS